jgi:hypothetical protein
VAGTAEAVVAVLFGNRLTQSRLPPLAYLHRPELQREPGTRGLRCAVDQALDWVPVEAGVIRHAWSAGVEEGDAAAITAVLDDLSMLSENPQHLHDFGTALGNPGCAGPWLAIAAAVESIQAEAAPHFIFNAERSADRRVWCAVVMPPSAN